jgi:hypothetical protein
VPPDYAFSPAHFPDLMAVASHYGGRSVRPAPRKPGSGFGQGSGSRLLIDDTKRWDASRTAPLEKYAGALFDQQSSATTTVENGLSA